MNFQWNQITLSLIAGLLMGAAVGGSPSFHEYAHKWDTRSPQERMLKRFAKRLDLTEDQKRQVATILEQKRAKMDALFNEMKPKFEQIRIETGDEIRQFLNPEQQKKFQAMDAEMSDRFNKRFPPHS